MFELSACLQAMAVSQYNLAIQDTKARTLLVSSFCGDAL